MAAPLTTLTLNSTTSTSAGPARSDAAQGDSGSDGSLFARLMQARTLPATDGAVATLDGAATTSLASTGPAAEGTLAQDPQTATAADMAQWLAQMGLVLPNALPSVAPEAGSGWPGHGAVSPAAIGTAGTELSGVAGAGAGVDPAALAASLAPDATSTAHFELPALVRAAGAGINPALSGPAIASRQIGGDPAATLSASRVRLDAVAANAAAGRRSGTDLAAGQPATATAAGVTQTAAGPLPATPVATASAVVPAAAVAAGPEMLTSRPGRELRELPESSRDGVSALISAAGALPAGALQPAPAAGAPVTAPAPVLNLPIALPVSDPAFGAAVMTRVAGLAGQGVQQAQLHLNPAEMGPIVVRIAVEQGQAQVDFQAAHAATRELLEGSMPVLAQAFQDDGLRLVASRVEALPEARPEGSATSQGWSGDTGQPSAGSGQPREQPAAAGQFRGTATAVRNGAVGGSDAVAAGGARPHGGPAGRLDLYA